MSSTTNSLGLTLDEETEFYDIAVVNDNLQKIDDAFAALDRVNNTSDSEKNVLSAQKLTTPRKINGIYFNGTKDITIYAGHETTNSAHNKNFSNLSKEYKVAGTASAGTSVNVARADHVHPAQVDIAGNAKTADVAETVNTISREQVVNALGYDPQNPSTLTKESVGLGNVDNTADKDKSVFHADEATNANYAERAATAVSATNALNASNATTAESANTALSATIAADSNAWCGYKLHAPMTKAEYDALTTKDSMTYYPIIG